MALRYEAWDLPTNASTFQRKLADIPVIEGTGTGYLVNGGGGGGEMAVPADFSRLSTIISSTAGSLIRVYDGTTLVHEWITERVDHDIIDGEGVVRISGPDIQALLGKAVVYAFDYPEQPSLDPDWHWGHDRNLLDNGGFEDDPNGIANLGFEDGTTKPWWAGAVDGVSATLAIDTGTVDAGTYAAKLDPLVAEGGMSVMANGLYPVQSYTVTARINAANTIDYQLGASGPIGLTRDPTDSTRVAEHSPGGQYGSPPGHVYEVQKDFTGTGVYASETVTFITAPAQEEAQINIRENEVALNGSDVFIDNVSIAGYGIGMEPWRPTSDQSTTTFEASTDVTADEGTYTGKVTAVNGHGIYQTVDNVLEGVTYSSSIRLRNTSGSARWSLELFDNRGQRLDQATVVTTTAFQTLTVTGELPEGSRWMEVRVINHSGAGATIYLDDAKLYRGQPPATVGTILGQLFDDAQTDHSADDRGTILTWLDDSGFDGTNDSGSTAWASTISFSAFWGDTYLNVLRNLTKLDYEWNITPKASPTAGSTHDLNVYEPAGLGTDYSATGTPAINFGQSTTGAALVQRIPGFTAVLAEGEEGIWDESEDATAQTNFGRWEEFSRALESNSTTELNTLNTELLAFESRNRLAAKVNVVANSDHPTPLVAYTVGDKVNWQVPPTLAKEARVIQEISYRNTEPATYQVTGSQVFHRETAAWEGIRRLLEEYRHRQRGRVARGSRQAVSAVAAPSGSVPTVMIATTSSSAKAQEIADFLCDGTDDDLTFEAAVSALPSGPKGRVLIAEGTYNFSNEVNFSVTSTADLTFEGLGHPRINSTGNAFADGGGSTLASVTYRGLRFTGGASGAEIIDCTSHTLVLDCIFESITAKTCIRMTQAQEVGTLVSGCWFRSVTISGGGGASPNGVFWSDTTGNRIYAAIVGNRFDNISGSICDMAGGGVQSVIGTGNQFRAATGKREGIWVHNIIDAVHTAGDHSGVSEAGIDSTAIHDNVAAEISAITEKTTPVAADLLVIEDSAAANAKKKVQIGNLLISNIANFSQQGTLSVGSGSFKLPFTTTATLASVQLAVGTVPTGADLVVDVNKNGTTIFTTQANRPTVPDGDADGVGAEATPDVTSIGEGEYLTVDIDQVGATVAGADLTVSVEWRPA